MKSIEERFTEKTVDVNGCWLWTASKFKNGYGRFRVAGETLYAHRVSYELFIDEIPNGLLVCHTCDVRHCVNPEHLFLGTHKDNMVDAMHKGRVATGDSNSMTKLSPEDIKNIRLLCISGESDKDVANIYNVHRGNIWSIRTGKTWKHII